MIWKMNARRDDYLPWKIIKYKTYQDDSFIIVSENMEKKYSLYSQTIFF